MARHKDANWSVVESPDTIGAQLTVLMDIRDELKALNAKLDCAGVRRAILQDIPSAAGSLRRIDKRLAKKVKLK
jgi:predicted component of type VI protein secretion system